MIWGFQNDSKRSEIINKIQDLYKSRDWVTFVFKDDSAVRGSVIRYDKEVFDIYGTANGQFTVSVKAVEDVVSIFQ